MRVELTLERARDSTRQADAWLLAGDDAARWIAELARWELPLDGLRLLPLPDGLGALAVPPEGARPAVTPGGLPYARVAARLFAPVDAVLAPAVSKRTLAGLLPNDEHVFHPRAGLIACEPDVALRVEELLIAPRRVHADWTTARPGPPPLPALTRIELADPPRHVLGADAGGDISSLRGAELPKAPGEPSNGPLARARRAAMRQVGEWIVQASVFAPSGANLPAWLDPLRARFKGLVKGWAEPDRSARQRELERLVHLLESDPDRGLRHAPPLGRPGDPVAEDPGDPRLDEREPELDLARAAAGRPVSPHDVDPAFYARLQELYRAAAERELRLGRFRRAAFVFLELLRDAPAAAGALRRGGHWTEAATIYRDHLKLPLAAAECLAEGGLLADAVALYEAHDEHERAARLYRRLEDDARADAAFRRAVDAHLAREEALEAARILERELGCADEALAVLAAQWPRGRRLGEVLRARFALLERMERGTELRALVPRLVLELDPDHSRVAAELAGALADLARRATEPGLGDEVEDATRLVAARALGSASASNAVQLAQAVARAGDDDRLLALDVDRWLDRQRAAAPRPAAARGVRLVREFRLGDARAVVSAAASPSGLVMLVLSDGHMEVVDCDLNGEAPEVTRLELPLSDGKLLFSADPRGAALVGPPGGAFWYRPAERAPFEPMAWIPRDVLAVELRGESVTLLRHDGDALVLARHALHGGLLTARHVAVAGELEALEPATLVHERDTCFVGLGRTLLRLDPGAATRVELASQVQHLAVPHLAQASRVVACMREGCALVPATAPRMYPIPLARDAKNPLAAFALSGRLVLATAKELRVYALEGRNARAVAQTELDAHRPIALLPAGGPRRVALVDRGAAVRVFELPRV